MGTTPAGATLGGRLSRRRTELNLTQSALAAKVGVEPWTITRWEHDRQAPRGESLGALARALDVSMEWLLSGDPIAAEG